MTGLFQGLKTHWLEDENAPVSQTPGQDDSKALH